MTQNFDQNLLDPNIFPNLQGPPHELFDLWRQSDPVHWNPPTSTYVPAIPGSTMDHGFWVLTRYADVNAVSADQERFSSYLGGSTIWDMSPEKLERMRHNFMNMRPDEHRVVRKAIMPPFAPRVMNDLAPKIDKIAAEIVDEIAQKGECEFVFDVASRLPVHTFCEMLGIPEAYRDRVEAHGNALADMESKRDENMDPVLGLFEICEELTAIKRAEPDDSLISTLVNDTELNLDQMEINQFFIVFAVAGHETTRTAATQFIRLMSIYPEQYALLKSDFDAHIDNAIEEVLRFVSPTTQFRRTASVDTEIGGHPVKAGDKIYLSYAAANRDPQVFPDPHRFDITRENAKRHLSFGIGPHICIGARLARMEVKALMRQIVTRLPDIHPVGDPTWLRSIWFNAIIKMPVAFTPER
jgi:cytochrome P450